MSGILRWRAASRARVVLPVPGNPEKIVSVSILSYPTTLFKRPNGRAQPPLEARCTRMCSIRSDLGCDTRSAAAGVGWLRGCFRLCIEHLSRIRDEFFTIALDFLLKLLS